MESGIQVLREAREEAAAIGRGIRKSKYIGAAIGLHAELMVLEGFARKQFVMKGRNTRDFGNKGWTASSHDLDFIFERDGVAYGLEVKNTLGYMDHDELKRGCEFVS